MADKGFRLSSLVNWVNEPVITFKVSQIIFQILFLLIDNYTDFIQECYIQNEP